MPPACLPQVSSSPLTQKISFLTGKGLTDSEVQQALAQAASGGSSSSPPPATAAADASKAATAGAQPPSWQQQQGPHQVPYPPYGHAAYGPAQGLVRPASPPRRDWRDYFVSARHPRPSPSGCRSDRAASVLPHHRSWRSFLEESPTVSLL